MLDLHGVLRIPPEIPIAELVEAGRAIDRLESEIFAECQSAEFGIDRVLKIGDLLLDISKDLLKMGLEFRP